MSTQSGTIRAFRCMAVFLHTSYSQGRSSRVTHTTRTELVVMNGSRPESPGTRCFFTSLRIQFDSYAIQVKGR